MNDFDIVKVKLIEPFLIYIASASENIDCNGKTFNAVCNPSMDSFDILYRDNDAIYSMPVPRSMLETVEEKIEEKIEEVCDIMPPTLGSVREMFGQDLQTITFK